MPIVTTQRRMAEHGRIRLGQKVTGTSRQGKEYTRPEKLDRFRFTSPNQALIEQIAARYGGEARAWDNKGKAEFEVISDARSLPVIVVKGGFSQWHEAWSAAGLQHRCDGEKDPSGTYCDPDDPAHIEAIQKPTTRLSVMLSEIESLGVWRMESKGWNAAAELPSMAELAMHVGDLVPATLSLAERSAVIDTPKGPQTSRFVVPVLDLHITKARLVELVGGVGGQPAIEQRAAAAIEQKPREDVPDYAGPIGMSITVDEVRALWTQARDAGHLTDELKAAFTARVEEIKAEEAAEQPQQQPAPAADVQTEEPPGWVTPQPTQDDVDTLWQSCVAEAGKRGWSLAALEGEFEGFHAIPVKESTAEQMAAFLQALRSGQVAA